MAWQVALVFDEGQNEESLHANLYILLGQMPVWVVAASERIPNAGELRERWNGCWQPEPALTVVKPNAVKEPVAGILDLVTTIQEHHSRLSALRLFGIERSAQLVNELASLDFHPISGTSWNGLGFAKPLDRIPDVPLIRLDANSWRTIDDFYNAFFNTVGAPSWHGRNLNALNDSIGAGSINSTEVPYRITVQNYKALDPKSKVFLEFQGFAELIHHLRANGCPVELRIDP